MISRDVEGNFEEDAALERHRTTLHPLWCVAAHTSPGLSTSRSHQAWRSSSRQASSFDIYLIQTNRLH